MNSPAAARDLRSVLREHWWDLNRKYLQAKGLVTRATPEFRKEAIRTRMQSVFGGVRPQPVDAERAAELAVAWLLRAQRATPDDGVSIGYFPCDANGPWRPSYPETTGYIIASLLEYASQHADAGLRERALAMAHWEAEVQMANGAVQSGAVCAPQEQVPAVFNTGMVLHGLSAAWREFRDPVVFEAAQRAANFLVNDLDEQNHFRSHGRSVSADRIKTYNVLCAWALYRFGEDSEEERFKDAALRNAVAAISMQNEDGWFASNCLTHPEMPLTHTIGYALQGLLETGVLAGRSDFVDAVQRGTVPLLAHVAANGYLPGRFDARWQPRVTWSCLTGSAQIAIVCYRLYELRGDAKFLDVANRLTNFCKHFQKHDSGDPAMNGALAGSFPIFGDYMSGGYPNWATKYLLDAVMLQARIDPHSA